MTEPCPECRALKCANCLGTTWDTDLDVLAVCPCWTLHEPTPTEWPKGD